MVATSTQKTRWKFDISDFEIINLFEDCVIVDINNIISPVIFMRFASIIN